MQTMEQKTNHHSGFTLGLVLGALFGASLGTLLAPHQSSGTGLQMDFQTERLRKRLRELRESLPEADLSPN